MPKVNQSVHLSSSRCDLSPMCFHHAAGYWLAVQQRRRQRRLLRSDPGVHSRSVAAQAWSWTPVSHSVLHSPAPFSLSLSLFFFFFNASSLSAWTPAPRVCTKLCYFINYVELSHFHPAHWGPGVPCGSEESENRCSLFWDREQESENTVNTSQSTVFFWHSVDWIWRKKKQHLFTWLRRVRRIRRQTMFNHQQND